MQAKGVFAAALVVSAAVLVAVGSGSSTRAVAVAQPVVEATCKPQIRPGILPDPPVITPATRGGTITLYAVQNGSAYCYTTNPADWRTYVDAPTIAVQQGETWKLVLRNALVQPSGSAMMDGMNGMTGPNPEPAPTTPDGCAQMPAGDTIPAPNATGVLGPVGIPSKRLYDYHAPPPGDTNFHTHGLHVEPIEDDVFRSTQLTQGHQCVQTFAIRTTQPAGTYWYHSHLHGLSNTQVGGGLAGALLVLPRNVGPEPPSRVILVKNASSVPQAAAVRLVAAALRAKNGWPMPSLAPGEFISGLRFDPSAPACPVGPNAQKIQVNGYPLDGMPIPRDVLLPGQQQRLRIINAQSNGYLDVAMRGPTGAPEVLTVVGRDGIPINATSDAETVALPNNPMDVQLPPGGRVDIVVTGQPRDQTLISDDKVCTGPAGPLTKLYQLALVGPGAAAHASALRAVPVPIKTVLPNATRAGVALAHHGHVIIDRYLTFSQYGDANFPFYVTATQPRAADVVENPFWLKRSTTPRDPNYYLEPNITTRQGNVERWHFINVTPEVHAFHIHQLTFLGLDSSVPDQRPRIANVRLDTILLPPGEVVKGKVTPDGYPILEATETVILIDFTNVDAGTFVYHCHMLFHEDHGMMGIIRVLPSPPPAMKT